jgi:ribosomal protein S6
MTSATTRRRPYRVSLILDLRGSAESPEAAIERLKEILQSIDCKVTEVENLGQREFSRAVDRNFLNGLYVQFHFEGPVNSPAAFAEKLRLDRTVDRIMVQVSKS